MMKTLPIAAIRYAVLSVALLSLLPGAAAQENEKITMAWRIKPPYQYKENGVDKGFLLERTKQAFALAKVPVEFIDEPAKRIWQNFKDGKKMYCSFGWYRLPEREAFANFSSPLHVDPPHTLLVAPVAIEKVKRHKTLASLLDDKELTLGSIDGASYGPEIDAMLAKAKIKIEKKVLPPLTIIKMVGANRLSFTFIDREDWDYIKDREQGVKEALQYDFADMPPGLTRYILCSKDVPQSVMHKIDAALATLKK